jgi:hypothetical protein
MLRQFFFEFLLFAALTESLQAVVLAACYVLIASTREFCKFAALAWGLLLVRGSPSRTCRVRLEHLPGMYPAEIHVVMQMNAK